ncbi:uncharacterized protein G2W53_021851 [Senna tora]|uniref:Uncharacterized protein n=1 Tax=Senna tora TaxID=362788 RepID=A0A834TK61_9FABA|nr:uncharacterized protein G2W53_021851 [Senna tora]
MEARIGGTQRITSSYASDDEEDILAAEGQICSSLWQKDKHKDRSADSLDESWGDGVKRKKKKKKSDKDIDHGDGLSVGYLDLVEERSSAFQPFTEKIFNFVDSANLASVLNEAEGRSRLERYLSFSIFWASSNSATNEVKRLKDELNKLQNDHVGCAGTQESWPPGIKRRRGCGKPRWIGYKGRRVTRGSKFLS